MPADLQSAYGLSANGGGGRIVALFGGNSDYSSAESDLGVYRAQYNLPPCTVTSPAPIVVGGDGGAPVPPADDGGSPGSGAVLSAAASVSGSAGCACTTAAEAGSPGSVAGAVGLALAWALRRRRRGSHG